MKRWTKGEAEIESLISSQPPSRADRGGVETDLDSRPFTG